MKRQVKNLLFVAAAILTIIPAAQATLLPPASTVPVSPFDNGGGSLTLLASESVPVTAPLYTGIIHAAVYRDAGSRDGISCPAGNCLDFMYQFENTGGSVAVSRETNINFLGFQTGVDELMDASSLPAGSPFMTQSSIPNPGLDADRDVSGQTVGFSFAPPSVYAIAPGQISPILIIATDATQFTAGSSFTIDGGGTSAQTYQPAAGVPEPASMLLIGAGLAGLVAFRRKALNR